MKIAFLQFAGFRGARDKVSLIFPSGFVVVSGRNGTGKSTLCDAIEFALSGQIRGSSGHKEKGEGILDYLWWRGASPPAGRFVELGLVDGTGQTYVIRRSPTGVSVTPDASLDRLLFHNSAVLEDPMSQLCRTAILRDEEITQLSVDLKEAERFNFVRAALGTADFATIERRIKEVQSILESQSTHLSERYNSANVKVAEAMARLSQARTEVTRTEDLSSAESVVRLHLKDSESSTDKLMADAERRLSDLRLRTDALTRLYGRYEELEHRRTILHSSVTQDTITELTAKLDTQRQNLEAAQRETAATAEQLRAG